MRIHLSCAKSKPEHLCAAAVGGVVRSGGEEEREQRSGVGAFGVAVHSRISADRARRCHPSVTDRSSRGKARERRPRCPHAVADTEA